MCHQVCCLQFYFFTHFDKNNSSNGLNLLSLCNKITFYINDYCQNTVKIYIKDEKNTHFSPVVFQRENHSSPIETAKNKRLEREAAIT